MFPLQNPCTTMWLAADVTALVADLLSKGVSRHLDVDHRDFRLERFAEGQPLASPHPYVGAGQMR